MLGLYRDNGKENGQGSWFFGFSGFWVWGLGVRQIVAGSDQEL